MEMSGTCVLLFAILCNVLAFGDWVCCNDTASNNNFFLKTARGRVIPRISGREANPGRNALERIFLKASKSIPRIGRTEQSAMEELNKQEVLFLPYFNPQDEYQNKMPLEYPIWSEVEKKYKYMPTVLLPNSVPQESSENGDEMSQGAEGDGTNYYLKSSEK